MKMTKKIMSLAIVFAMVMAMSVSVFAAQGTNSNDGKITINDAEVGHTYEAYQILKLESYNVEAKAYAYKATETWAAFINSDAIKGVYVNVDSEGYVTWVENADPAKFAKLAQEYADEHQIAATKTAKAETEVVVFDALNLGYYLIDTNLGTLCALDTTAKEVEMYEKNDDPTVAKKVQEDDGAAWGTTNTAQIGDTVNFEITVNAKAGAESYVVTDTMGAGLTLKADTVVVGNLVKDTDYTITTENHKFVVTFAQAYLDKIASDTEIKITYSAVLNENALIATDTNDNTVVLQYGEKGAFTKEAKTTTTTYQFAVNKFAKDIEDLAGATFKLMKGETVVKLVKIDDNTYCVANGAEETAGETFVTVGSGDIVIKGVDTDADYKLVETAAPDGYNILPSAVTVAKIAADNSTVVDVENKTGTELPSTGGIGTTIFYALGGLMAVGAGVLLIAKKRMEA